MPAINLRATKGGRNMAPVSRKQKMHSVGRLLRYVFKYYSWQFILVILCVILSAGVGVVGSYFLGTILIDDYVNVALSSGQNIGDVVPVRALRLVFTLMSPSLSWQGFISLASLPLTSITS
jgi:ABC-type multidrug transport system fused ATPase/permease subunit